jgi:hypothetical protein
VIAGEVSSAERPLRLTVGELAFAVAQLISYEKAAKLVMTQFPMAIEDALAVIQLSGQSLHARELATQIEPTVQLVPAVTAVGYVLGTAEWMLRCSKVPAGAAERDVESTLFHLSGSGVLAHTVISEHVQELVPVRSFGALLGRAAACFGLSHVERDLPRVRLPRDVFDGIWAGSDAAAVEAKLGQLRAPAIPGLIREGLAEDLASPMWKGGLSRTHYPQGREPEVAPGVYLAAGRRTWMIVADSPSSVTVCEASRQRFAEAATAAIEVIPAAQRAFV